MYLTLINWVRTNHSEKKKALSEKNRAFAIVYMASIIKSDPLFHHCKFLTLLFYSKNLKCFCLLCYSVSLYHSLKVYRLRIENGLRSWPVDLLLKWPWNCSNYFKPPSNGNRLEVGKQVKRCVSEEWVCECVCVWKRKWERRREIACKFQLSFFNHFEFWCNIHFTNKRLWPNDEMMFVYLLVLSFLHTASRKLEEQGGYNFTITSVPSAFNFKAP